MKRLAVRLTLISIIILALGNFATAQATQWYLAIPPPATSVEPPVFYYVTGTPAGTAATYTTLPAWFPPSWLPSGGIAVAPDSTGATGFHLTLPSTWAPTAAGLTGNVYSCDGTGCSAADPFGQLSKPGAALLVDQ